MLFLLQEKEKNDNKSQLKKKTLVGHFSVNSLIRFHGAANLIHRFSEGEEGRG